MDHTLLVILLCVAAFFLGALVVYGIIGLRINSILREERIRYLRRSGRSGRALLFRYLPLVMMLKIRKDHYKHESTDLGIAFEEERKAFYSLEQKYQNLNEKLADKERQIRELNRIIRGTPEGEGLDDKGRQPSRSFGRNPETAPLDKEVIYFGIPDSDGNFSAEKGSSEPDDRKMYRILPDRKGESGELHYVPGQSDLKAIDNIDYYLIPVCEVENISDRSFATKVWQTEPGKVVLISCKWVCDKKIKVKLI